MKQVYLFICLFILSHKLNAKNNDHAIAYDTLIYSYETGKIPLIPEDSYIYMHVPDTVDTSAPTARKSHKIIIAIFSFPFPFGILGLHRIFLGTKPYMPFVYIGTLGGCFGILPMIDFITILLSDKDSFSRFENNSRVFMWSH